MMDIDTHEGHSEDQSWAGKIKPGECVFEIRARCRICQEGQLAHFSEAERKEWFLKHGGEHWIYAYYRDDLDWDIESGVCGACRYTLRQLSGRLN